MLYDQSNVEYAKTDGNANSRNEAYCEFDIVTNYKFEKRKSREEKKKHIKENNDLYQKIAELAARNDKLKQLETETNGGVNSENADDRLQDKNRPFKEHRRHHYKDGQGLGTQERSRIDKMGKRIEHAATPKEKSRERDSSNGERRHRESSFHRDGSRREHSKRRSSLDEKREGNLQLDNGHKIIQRIEDPSELIKNKLTIIKANISAETKPDVSQTVNFLTNSIPSGPVENQKQVITVYENKNLSFDTDSFLSHTTIRRLSLRSPSRSRKPTIIQVNSRLIRDTSSQREETTLQPEKIREYRHRHRSRTIKAGSKPDAYTETVKISDKCIGISPRKELSFSNLNLMPAVTDYGEVPLAANTQTSVSKVHTHFITARSIEAKKDDRESHPPKDALALREMLKIKELDLGPFCAKPYSFYLQDKEVENALSIIPQQDCSKSFKTTFAKNSRFRKRKQGFPSEAIVDIPSKTPDDQTKSKLGKAKGVFTVQVFPGVSLSQTKVGSNPEYELRKVDKLASLKACTIIGQEIVSKVTCETCSSLALNTPSDSGIARSKDESKQTITSQNLSDITYRSRRRLWPSREYMRRSGNKNSKHRVKHETTPEVKRKPRIKRSKSKPMETNDQIAQTLVLEAAVQTIPTCAKPSANIGVMVETTEPQFSNCEAQTQSCHETGMLGANTSVKTNRRVQVNETRGKQLNRRNHRSSQSESDITRTEELVTCHDYDIYTVAEPSNIPVRIKEKPAMKGARIQEQRPNRKTEVKSRKYSRSCSPESRNSSKLISPIKSTGSIQPQAVSPRRSKLKNSSYTRTSLVDKVNFNKETIMHHNKEIAALEKCLTEILQRLAHVKTASLDLDNLPSEKSATIANSVSSERNAMVQPVNSEIPMSKFHRAKAYGEKLKQRSKETSKLRKHRSPTKRNESNQKHKVCKYRYSYGTHFVPTVNVKSVYKNPKGFISSASSFSSKISELNPSSGTEITLSNDSNEFPANNRRSRCDVESRPSTTLDHSKFRRMILKKKHMLKNQKQMKYSKKKSQSIFDMLRAYINLSSSSSKQESTHLKGFKGSGSKVVVLSVSSLKFKTKVAKRMKTFKEKLHPPNAKQPFFMSSEFAPHDVTSADSLEMDTSKTVDLCPLTAIFNIEPPSYAYHVYNAEIILNNPPNGILQPSSATASVQVDSTVQHLSPSSSGIFLSSTAERTYPSTSIQNESSREEQSELRTILPPPPTIYYQEIDNNDLNSRFTRRILPNLSECMRVINSDAGLPPSRSKIKMTSFKQANNHYNPVIFNYKKKSVPATIVDDIPPPSTCSKAMRTKLNERESENISVMSSSQTVESSPKMNPFKNFFKRRTLLDIFKSKHSKLKLREDEMKKTPPMRAQKEPQRMTSSGLVTASAEKKELDSPLVGSKTVLWFNFKKKKRDSNAMCDPWCKSIKEGQTRIPQGCRNICHAPLKSADYGHTGTFVDERDPGQPRLQRKCHTDKYANVPRLGVASTGHGCSSKDLMQSKEHEDSYSNRLSDMQLDKGSLSIADETEEEVVSAPQSAESSACSRTQSTDRDRVRRLAVLEHRRLSDREVFEKLLRSYERKDTIAMRLSRDERFFSEQIQMAKSGNLADMQVRDGSIEEKTYAPDATVRPDDIGTCFARGFRPDNLLLSGDACFHINKQDKIKVTPHMLTSAESIIDFSERETPLEFLLALGFMVDEASNALKDDNVRSRLQAAITEARVWINKITTTQGTLLYLVSYKARPETMRYFLQLVEAIINRRINNAIRLDGFLRVLEDVEAGKLQMINILGEEKFEDEENEEKIVMKQLKNLFVTVFNIAEREASASGRKLVDSQVKLLRILVAKYRAGLHPHLDLIARYIGQGLLQNEVQLEAAMIFLSRLDTADVKLKEFENYCGISC